MTRILLGVLVGFLVSAPFSMAYHGEERYQQPPVYDGPSQSEWQREQMRQEQFRNRLEFDRLNRPC